MSEFRATIDDVYNGVAERAASGVCCSPNVIYSPEELAQLPEQATMMSSGCGHPVRFSQITPGSVVVDIGSGGGLDSCLAARLTGDTGKVIGVDPSAKMRERARAAVKAMDLNGVEFVEGTAENIPLPEGSADIVISNCVLSLALDCRKVWLEIGRVLKPGGRFTVSDVIGGSRDETATTKARCETGFEWADYRRFLVEAGFSRIQMIAGGAVEFRDSKRIQSATIRGRWGMNRPGAFVQVFYRDYDKDAVGKVVKQVLAAFRDEGLSADIETVDLRMDGADGVLHLIKNSSESDSALPLPKRLYVVVDGWIGAEVNEIDDLGGYRKDMVDASAVRQRASLGMVA